MARSFFAKLTGATDDDYDFTATEKDDRTPAERHMHVSADHSHEWSKEEPGGELAVDVFQNADAIVVKALIAGVPPGSIDIALTREMLTISGKREEEREVEEDNYFRRELYWGAFSRTILLPEEVDVDLAEASEKHGILTIRLPKINKKKEMRLKVKAR
jgi:HSP20 family protein